MADVECVVVVGKIDHPGLDERLCAGHMSLEPGCGLRERFRNGLRLPFLTVNELRKGALQIVVGRGVRLTDQERFVRADPSACFHRLDQRLDDVLQVNECLSVRDVARKHFARERALEDALDLVGEQDRMAVVFVHAGHTKRDDGNSSVFSPNQILGGDF